MAEGHVTNLEEDQAPSRYVVGIDLGTTNSAVGYVDTEQQPLRVETFVVPQLVAPGEVEGRDTLPSFHYQAATNEFPAGALKLPWDRQERDYCVGFFARDHGAVVPGRLIASAKSWLSHNGVDRTADLLPWHGAPDVERLSPVEASARILAHVREAWDYRRPQHPLAGQDVVLTLPASFDEVARELTIKAARLAGLHRVWLLEEPQAAFYAWINKQGSRWEEQVRPGQKILVCDIGGGTSDFTLIRVRAGEGGRVQFHRVAVGPHLILGGDNLDLALAHHLEPRLAPGGKLEPRVWGVLVRLCRQLKETLLGADPPESYTLRLPGTGSRLVGGGLQTVVSREEAQQVLLDGFLPKVPLDARPASRRMGLQEFGLPYAPDPAITRYLAAFLTAHRFVGLDEEQAAAAAAEGDPARPDIVLFNGGLFESPALRDRLLEVLASWFTQTDAAEAWRPLVLRGDRLDMAVAHGAAYYGLVRRGIGVKISAALARSYYIGVEGNGAESAAAVCLVPGGTEEGERIDLDRPLFHLRIREPVEFPLYVSSTRLVDRPGQIVPVDREQMSPLPPIRTVLQSGKKSAEAEILPVNLHAGLTEIGTLDLWCSEAGGPRSWRLQFDVRATTQTDVEAHAGLGERGGFVDEALVAGCAQIIAATYRPTPPGQKQAAPDPAGIVKRLEEATGMRRGDWPPSLLRSMWEPLMEHEEGRRKSPQHEARWLWLLGYCLRPGYGLAVDDWRVGQSWRLFQGKKLAFPAAASRVEWFILWRRIGGGLQPGQQRALAEPLTGGVGSLIGRRGTAKGKGSGTHEAAETLRLLGSLELLPVSLKINLGNTLASRLAREETAALRDAGVWALGRIAARVPTYGPLNSVTPAAEAALWVDSLLQLDYSQTVALALLQAARRTGDRYRDLADRLRGRVANWLERNGAPRHYVQLVTEGGDLDQEEEGLVFGESLPRGLRLAIGPNVPA